MLFQMNICILASSPRLMAITFPSMTAIALRVAAETKSEWTWSDIVIIIVIMIIMILTLKIALSLSSRSSRFFLGSSRVVCSSSFQSLAGHVTICHSHESHLQGAVTIRQNSYLQLHLVCPVVAHCAAQAGGRRTVALPPPQVVLKTVFVLGFLGAAVEEAAELIEDLAHVLCRVLLKNETFN